MALTADDSGTEVALDRGDRIELTLESNRTTGYEWALAAFDQLDGILMLRGERFIEPNVDVVGAAGTQVFVFEAVEAGAGILRLEYLRPFDDPPVPARVVEYVIRVERAEWPPPDGGTAPTTATATA